jgi:nitrite reductase/ring-hydroxylating ferredoxin subunit
MADAKRVICNSADLAEKGKGVRFSVERDGKAVPAFAVRHHGKACAYLNRCAHLGVELDWEPGEFFDSFGVYLICATHGAAYRPDDGHCIGGPCKGKKLEALDIAESDGVIYLTESV